MTMRARPWLPPAAAEREASLLAGFATDDLDDLAGQNAIASERDEPLDRDDGSHEAAECEGIDERSRVLQELEHRRADLLSGVEGRELTAWRPDRRT